MKRYLLHFTSAILFTTLSAKSESIWLILQNSTYEIEIIEMRDMSQCEEQAKEYSKSSGIPRYLCLIGK